MYPDTVRKLRPKGGYLLHLVPPGTTKALCGYQPSSPKTHQMSYRHGWLNSPTGRPCQKCADKLSKLQAKENA